MASLPLSQILAERSSETCDRTPRRSHPPLSGGRPRRSASIAQDRPVLGRAALPPAGPDFVSFSCSRPMSRSIGQPLANDTTQCTGCTLYIIHPERNPLVVAEIELREITLQVLLADVMIDTVYTALKDREVAFNGISPDSPDGLGRQDQKPRKRRPNCRFLFSPVASVTTRLPN